ncbi:three-Cys-motif partner protein TcmP [Nocardioides sp. MAH-18]|uniref:Three-Cys-motif partner protein TcmP n=1 Tax=Nocardioides agri TaxID=2682843 RepID=A0A6L6XY07_9ACTN|nr:MULTISPECIES: three-Cys-motif partner protein TcmP [unclassified Nocardioides]MBA2952127.1 three-Cys-motif partner protein TcmP [Nocardioides sp. CGMCC 1.13656]MVQ51296.1 three-Cys-motif partner protein TcmP [Nocardioides sp. MAH-18]
MARRGDKLPTRWTRWPHTKAKHDLLVRYLQAWFPIMGRTAGRAIVLDAFAGPGRYDHGEDGSPVLVLETLLEHNDFDNWKCEFVLVFNELDPERFESLGDVLREIREDNQPWPDKVKLIDPRNQSFEDLGNDMLRSLKGAKMAPTFAFIDPFGYMGLPLELIAEMLSYDRCELFIYFDFNSVNRFATAGNVDKHFERLFGTDEFKDAPDGGPERQQFLHDLYERQLKSVCNFAYVRSFAMVNQGGHIGNYMFFCTRNLQAFDRMKEAMWKLAPSGDYRFEDRLADQLVLFDNEDATGPLRDYLLEHYAGQTVPIKELVDHVIAETPFHSTQVRRATLKPMQEDNLIHAIGQTRKGTYKEGVVSIVFPST